MLTAGQKLVFPSEGLPRWYGQPLAVTDLVIPGYLSSRWQERGFTSQQAHAYYDPVQASSQQRTAKNKLIATRHGAIGLFQKAGEWT